MKIGFDSKKYLKLQRDKIREKIKMFDKLYLEFGGKLVDDYHAARVLPGFMPDIKIKLLQELKDELDNLINVRRPENIIAIKEARSLGDLSENAEYDAARNEQAQIEARIKQLEKMLENAEIISETSTDQVGIGNTVSIKYVDDDEEDEYKIVGSQEANPFESKISNESPIAKALLNHKVGDLVTVDSPNGSYEVEIIEIK